MLLRERSAALAHHGQGRPLHGFEQGKLRVSGTSPGAAEFISGVIMHDETIRQKSLEAGSAGADDPPHHREWRDD